jgi:O-acetylserine/cysteine efflux transporter
MMVGACASLWPWPSCFRSSSRRFPVAALLAICLLSGPIHFGIIYVAFGLAKSLSPLVVATQLWIPFTALFAWKMLGETMKPPAVAGWSSPSSAWPG